MMLLSPAAADFAQVEMTPAPQPPAALDDQNGMPTSPTRPAGLIEIVLRR